MGAHQPTVKVVMKLGCQCKDPLKDGRLLRYYTDQASLALLLQIIVLCRNVFNASNFGPFWRNEETAGFQLRAPAYIHITVFMEVISI